MDGLLILGVLRSHQLAVVRHRLFHESRHPRVDLLVKSGEFRVLVIPVTQGFEYLQRAFVEMGIDSIVPAANPVLDLGAD